MADQPCILSIDVGTTTICGVALSAKGELLDTVERPNDSAMPGVPASRAEQSPTQILTRVVDVIQELTKTAHDVAVIGLTGQMHGLIGVDSNNKPTTHLITWQDGRCLEKAQGDETWLDHIRARVPAEAWKACGCEPAGGYLGCTLFWLTQNSELPHETKRVCFIHDYIAAALTEQLPVTDPSDAGSSGIFDLSRNNWHDRIIDTLELPKDLLPPVRESGEIVGHLSPTMAEQLKLPAGTPVCNAIGDNQASVLGSIADIDRSILINLGTGGQISWTIPTFERSPGMETRYLPHQRFMLVGASLCGGRSYAWLKDFIQDWLADLGHTSSEDEVYSRLNELAESVQDTGGLKAKTTLQGTRANPDLRGSFERIGLQNFKLGNVSRAVLEGVVEELASMYDAAGDGDSDTHDTIVASGNAVRKNPLLRKIIAQRMDRPVRIPKHREEAAFGAALLAGTSVGIWPDLKTAGQCVKYEE